MTMERGAARRRPRPPRLATKLLALLLAIGVAGAIAEVIVRIARPGYPGFRLPQVEHRPVSGLGFEIIPSQQAYTWAAPARINSIGFRGPEPRNPPGRPLVLCVGDSMTFGNSVPEGDTYPFQLQQLMQREWPQIQAEAFNMGVQRYFTYQELELIRRYVPRLRPDVVTLAVYLNDLGLRPTLDFAKEYENERERAAREFHNVVPPLYLLLKNSATLALIKDTYLGAMKSRSTGERALDGDISAGDEPKWLTIEEDLVTFRELANTHGFRPYVVFVPARPQVRHDMPQSAYPRRLVEHAKRQRLIAIDPIDAFKRELRAGRDPYLPWDDHMSATGHRLVAEMILEQLRQHGIWQTGPTVASGSQQAAPQTVP